MELSRGLSIVPLIDAFHVLGSAGGKAFDFRCFIEPRVTLSLELDMMSLFVHPDEPSLRGTNTSNGYRRKSSLLFV